MSYLIESYGAAGNKNGVPGRDGRHFPVSMSDFPRECPLFLERPVVFTFRRRFLMRLFLFVIADDSLDGASLED